MAELKFSRIHNVVIDALEGNRNNIHLSQLEVIGSWYFRFLSSDKDKLTLKLPEFSLEFSIITFNYIRLFAITYNLFKKKRVKCFEGTFLLNVFKYKPTKNEINIEDYILDFQEENNEIITWKHDTYTGYDRFLPVFKKEQLKSKFDLLTIYYTFKLFKSIRLNGLINYPVLIDFEEDINLVFNPFKTENEINSNKLNDLCNELNLDLFKSLNDDRAADLEEKLMSENILNRINIKFPYSKRPHLYLTSLGKKRLDVEFHSRFYYTEPLNSDLIIVPDELNHSNARLDFPVVEFLVVNTHHRENLFKLLAQFKEDWKNLELNKFLAPFPKYWLLFINHSESKEEWIKQFKLAYPTLLNNPIIKDIEVIITELYDLNWIEKAIATNSNYQLIFPDLKGLRNKRLNWAFNNFKNYVESLYSNITFNDSFTPTDTKKASNIIHLNAFDVIGLSNVKSTNNSHIKVMVPDFMYYGYQPWTQYHIYKYRTNALLDGLRGSLDPKYQENKADIEAFQKELINDIKKDLKVYKNKFEEKVVELEPIELNIEESEDLELMSSEEVEELDTEINDNQELRIITTDGDVLNVNARERVLLQRDYLRFTAANNLLKGDLFLDFQSFKSVIHNEDFISKLSQQPDCTRKYQANLFERGENIYSVLRKRGVSFTDKKYFLKNYLIPKNEITEENHIIPIRKSDWKIICEVLSIDESDMNLAFIAYYGRKKQNRLQELYKLILQLYLKNGNLQSTEDPEFMQKAESIISQFSDVFNKNEDYSLSDIAETIVSNITHSIVFKIVKKIQKL